MEIEDIVRERIITITLTESEAKQLYGLAMYFPFSGETRVEPHCEFAYSLIDLLDEKEISEWDRSKFITKSTLS